MIRSLIAGLLRINEEHYICEIQIFLLFFLSHGCGNHFLKVQSIYCVISNFNSSALNIIINKDINV